MLVDRATIYVRSGKGGDGCMSFRREKFVPKGGPDGGDGGRGGDVILVGDPHLDTLLPLTHRPHRRAKNGKQGEGSSRTGADGEHCEVPVPLGTLVHDRDSGELVADVQEPGERIVVAVGGKGGLGNEHFKSATNQTPRESTPGEDWQERTLDLQLKLIADVGLIGLPNAGKSTMLSVLSRARPKVASYPFTTLQPHLGIAELSGERRLVFADIPGLIEGAASGAGLGHEFLAHIERTTALVHVVDVMPLDGSEPAANYRAIRGELAAYSEELAAKREIVFLNKTDLIPPDERAARVIEIQDTLELDADQVVISGSGATGDGVDRLLDACWLQRADENEPGWATGGP